MKVLSSIILSCFLFSACVSGSIDSGNKREVAKATQRVGEAYYNSGKYTAALQNLLEAYKTLPDDPYLNNSLGLTYMAKGRHDLAEKHFKKALEIKPDYIQAKNNLGAAYLKQKKWTLAIECFEAVSKNLLYATPEIPMANLGWAYFNQNMMKKAKLYFEKALDFRPDFLIAVHGIASVYLETGYYYDAIDYLKGALGKNPGAAVLHSDLAKAYEAVRNFDAAKRSWNVVIKLSPEASPLAREAQKRLSKL